MIGVGPIEQPCIKGSNVSMRNINVMTIEYDFLKKKKKIIFNTCTFYLFIYDKPIHALILYEQRKRNKAYTLGISCK